MADYLLPPFFSIVCFCRSYLYVLCVGGSHSTHPTPEISMFSCCRSRKSMPPKFSLFLAPSSIVDCTLVAVSSYHLCLLSLPLSPRLVDIACPSLSRWSFSGYCPRCCSFLFIPFVLYNHRITYIRPYTSNQLPLLLFPSLEKKKRDWKTG